MALLLDTHTFLWFLNGDSRLTERVSRRISDPAEDVFVSVVCAWEILIKSGVGKLKLDDPFEEFWRGSVAENEFSVLDVTFDHVLAAGCSHRFTGTLLTGY